MGSLELDLWSWVSLRLCICLDTLKRLDGDNGGGVEVKEVKAGHGKSGGSS